MIRAPTPPQDPSVYCHLSEKERMIRGYPYLAWDPILKAERLRARTLVEEFNRTPSGEIERRRGILLDIFSPETSPEIKVMTGFQCDYGYNITLGKGTELNYNCCLLDGSTIRIGERVMFAPNVQLYTSTHPLDPKERAEYELAKPISIGDDTWLGGNVTVCPGVDIGVGVTVGAGSVVTRNVPSHTVVARNPAKIIRFLPGYKGDFQTNLK